MIEIRDDAAVPNLDSLPGELKLSQGDLGRFVTLRNQYKSAIKEIATKLDILDDEFRIHKDYTPIHSMEARLKSIDSTVEKLQRRGLPVTLDGMRDLTDIAGIRVICNYVDDLYTMADLLLRQDDIELIARKDYIASPKESGYRSLHLVVLVPVFQATRTERIPVEIQLRTIAMDTWASLEHELKYKKQGDIGEEDRAQLVACAEMLADVDERMQQIHRRGLSAQPAEPAEELKE